jgi:plastocyanin
MGTTPSRRVAWGWALVGLSVWLIGPESRVETREPVVHTVTIEATRFQPTELTVKAGDSILWVNKDLFPHTVTSKRAGLFDSRVIAAGASWTYTPTTKGIAPYFCVFHPTMTGTLRVRTGSVGR